MPAGPWDKFAPPQQAAGPWDKFAAPAEASTAGDVAKSFGIGIPKGVMGLAGLPGDVSNLIGRGINAAGNYFTGGTQTAEDFAAKRAAMLGGPDIAAPTSAGIRRGVESVTGPLYEPQTTPGKYAQTVGEFLPAAALGGTGGLARRAILDAAIPGVTSEAAGQLTEGTAAEPYARTAAALAAPIGARRLVTPLAPRGGATYAGNVANLQGEGVRDLTAGQLTGNRPLQWLEQSLGDVTGAGARKVERGQEQFTRAVLRRAGEDAPRATPEVIDNAFTRIGNQFDNLAANNTLHPDAAMGPQLRTAVNNYDSIVSPPNRAPAIRNFEQEIAQALGANNGTIPGGTYQSLRSRMEATARSAPYEVADTLRDMKSALDSAMERHLQRIGSSDLGAWQQARREYRNILPIERAATAAGSDTATGLISPSSLRNAVVAQSRRGYARGQGDLADLARSGEAVMKPLPQSGTAPRAYMMSLPASVGALIGGAVSGNPLLAAGGAMGVLGPPIGGRLLMSRPVQRYLGNRALPPPTGLGNYLPAAMAGNVPGYAEGGRPDPYQPALVGEQGPEMFVPDRPGTMVPNDAFAAAAQRMVRAVRPPGGRQEGAGTAFIEGGYGLPAAYRSLDRGAQQAFESAGSLQRGGSYDPGPVLQQAIGAAGGPLVGATQEGAMLGADAIRRAIAAQMQKAALHRGEPQR